MKSRIQKEDKERRLVWGEVVAPNRPFVPDSKHGNEVMYMSSEDIEALAFDYMTRKNEVGVDLQHNNKVIPGCTIVESFIARAGDPDFIEGSWVVCCHVDDDATWEKIKNGEINGFSMEALVLKEEVEVEVEIPDTVKGSTSEANGHTHTFTVSFGTDGDIDGSTNVVAGHSHRILAGTITQESQGHTHRFSSVDNIEIIEDDD